LNPIVKYSLARIVLFAVCVGLVFVPDELNPLLKLLIALLVSAAASFVLLRAWRNELAEQLSVGSQRRRAEKERLRAALAGEDEPPADAAKPS
jgi:hypothetical protein